MSIFFEILVRIASYGPQIDQSHGENRLSHIIKDITTTNWTENEFAVAANNVIGITWTVGNKGYLIS